MPAITINSDLTTQNTNLSIDKDEVTKNKKVINIQFDAYAPHKDYTDSGWIDFSITTVDDDGNVERKVYSKSAYANEKQGIGKTVENADELLDFIGSGDTRRIEIVDTIVDHCKENKIPCPSKDSLLGRKLNSLQDKLDDLGIKLEERND